MTKDKKVQWHPGFYGAMHLELRENKEDLEFTKELILNTLPLRVDMLVVKKKISCEIQNEIGKLFDKHNLIEYKSPSDSLNYDVFLKGIAYAYLYKSNEEHVDEICLEEVTLSFIREAKPIKLIKKLREEKFDVEQKYPGIYYIIKEKYIKIQIIVTRELREENHIWLNALSDKMKKNQVLTFLKTAQGLNKLDEQNYADSLWDIVATVNQEVIRKIREDEKVCKGLAEIMKPELEEAFNNGFDNGFNNGSISSFKNMIRKGMTKELAQECAGLSDELVEKALAEMK
ncbi:MAG: hypothetical protein IKW08_09885 [Roseburia sp.]|nr:hypothetical protein [Roseburia sp.]